MLYRRYKNQYYINASNMMLNRNCYNLLYYTILLRKCNAADHFSDSRFPPSPELSGGSYFSRTGNILMGGIDSGPKAGYMKSTPPSFHSPAWSTNTDETLTLLWMRLQSTFRKLSAFCNKHKQVKFWPHILYSIILVINRSQD